MRRKILDKLSKRGLVEEVNRSVRIKSKYKPWVYMREVLLISRFVGSEWKHVWAGGEGGWG